MSDAKGLPIAKLLIYLSVLVNLDISRSILFGQSHTILKKKGLTPNACSQREYLIMASSKTNRYEYICVDVILLTRCKNCAGLTK